MTSLEVGVDGKADKPRTTGTYVVMRIKGGRSDPKFVNLSNVQAVTMQGFRPQSVYQLHASKFQGRYDMSTSTRLLAETSLKTMRGKECRRCAHE